MNGWPRIRLWAQVIVLERMIGQVTRIATPPSLGGWLLPDVADGEALGKRVVRVDDVGCETGDPRPARDGGHDRRTAAHRRLLDQPTGEDRAQDPRSEEHTSELQSRENLV